MRISAARHILSSHPRRWQVSPIFQRVPDRDTPCYNTTAHFGTVSSIAREFQILVQGDFCYKKNSTAAQTAGRGFHEGKSLFYCRFDYLLIWHDRLIRPGNSSLRKLFWGWLFIVSCAGDVCMKICHDRETYLRWVLLLLHSLQLTLQLTSLPLWSLSNKISIFFCNIRKIARHNNQQNWTGPTFCQPWLGFVRLVISAMEIWNIWWFVEFNLYSLFEITSLLIEV